MTDQRHEPSTVLSFWFDGAEPAERISPAHPCYQRWFGGAAALDAEITQRFSSLVELARAGGLDTWTQTPRGTLALVLLLDQFPRHIYRGHAEAFASDVRAMELVNELVDSGKDETLSVIERTFLYLPLQHSEDLRDHERALERFVALRTWAHANRPSLARLCEMGVANQREHMADLERFGRYPYRNAALGRTSTAEEHAYLQARAEA